MNINLSGFDLWPLCCAIDTRISFLKSIKETNVELFYKCLYDVEIEILRALRDRVFVELSK